MEYEELHSSPVKAPRRDPPAPLGMRPASRRGKGTTLPSSQLTFNSGSRARGVAGSVSPGPSEPPRKRRGAAPGSVGGTTTTRRTIYDSGEDDDNNGRGRTSKTTGTRGRSVNNGSTRHHGSPHTPKTTRARDILAPTAAQHKRWNAVSSSPDALDLLSSPSRDSPTTTPVLAPRRDNHASTSTRASGKTVGAAGGKRKMRAMEATYLGKKKDDDATPKANSKAGRATSPSSPTRANGKPATRRDSAGNSFFATVKAKQQEQEEAEFAEEEAQWRDRDEEQFRAIKQARDAHSSKIDSATAFFASVPAEAAAARRRRSLEKRSAVLAQTGPALPQEPTVDEDERYYARFKDPNNLCPHCGEPLPKRPSPHLTKLQRRHAAAESLSFHQTVSFCHMHRAETRTIPLGLRDGYPDKLDFERVDRRLETGFVATRLRRIAAKPHLSKFFRRARHEIDAMGVAAWKDVSHQGTDRVLTYASPGYYGDLGRAVIIRHVQLLLQWGYLRFTDAIAPLPEPDFIVTVLVPEAAILLIMGDRGWDSDVCKGGAWAEARKDAMECHKRSGAFGHWRFPDDADDGRAVLQRLEKGAGAKHRRLEALRAAAEAEIQRKIREEKSAITRAADPDAAVVVVSSDTETADASEWSGDEVWNDDVAVRLVEQYDDDTTPKARRLARTSSVDDDGDTDY